MDDVVAITLSVTSWYTTTEQLTRASVKELLINSFVDEQQISTCPVF